MCATGTQCPAACVLDPKSLRAAGAPARPKSSKEIRIRREGRASATRTQAARLRLDPEPRACSPIRSPASAPRASPRPAPPTSSRRTCECAGRVPRSVTGQSPASDLLSSQMGDRAEPCQTVVADRATSPIDCLHYVPGSELGRQLRFRHVHPARKVPRARQRAKRGCNAAPPAKLQLPRVQLEPMSHKTHCLDPAQGPAKGLHPREGLHPGIPVQGRSNVLADPTDSGHPGE